MSRDHHVGPCRAAFRAGRTPRAAVEQRMAGARRAVTDPAFAAG